MAIVSSVADLLLEWTLTGNSSLPLSASYLGWCTGAPGDSTSTTSNELSSGTYATRQQVLNSIAEYSLPGEGGGALLTSTASVSWSPTASNTLTYFVIGNSSTPGLGHNFYSPYTPSYTTTNGVNFYFRDERLRISLTGTFFTVGTATSLLRSLFRYSSGTDRVWPSGTTRYFGLSTTIPYADGSNITELSGNNYSRVGMSDSAMYGSASPEAASNFGLLGRALANSGAVTFPTASADWSTVYGWFVASAASDGTIHACGPLDNPMTVLSGTAASFLTDEFVCSLY